MSCFCVHVECRAYFCLFMTRRITAMKNFGKKILWNHCQEHLLIEQAEESCALMLASVFRTHIRAPFRHLLLWATTLRLLNQIISLKEE